MVACPSFTCRGTTLMSSIVDQLTELYVFVDDFLTTHPAVAQWRQSPHNTPEFADAEVLRLALLQGCLGVASLQQTYRLVAHNYRSAFPQLCSYPPWIARLQALAAPISALLMATTQIPAQSPAFYLIDAKPLPVCHRLRHGRVRLLRRACKVGGCHQQTVRNEPRIRNASPKPPHNFACSLTPT